MRLRGLLLCSAIVLMSPGFVNAHFMWLVSEPAENPTTVQLYFSESASPDDPALLERLGSVEAFVIAGGRAEPKKITFEKTDDGLAAKLSETSTAPVVLQHTYGVTSRGGETFLLKYYAKAQGSALRGSWEPVAKQDLLPLEIIPKTAGKQIAFEVLFNGKPAKGATVTVVADTIAEPLEGEVDENGEFRCTLPEAGLYSVRARLIETATGKHEDKEYASIRHYSTLSLPYTPTELSTAEHKWPALSNGTTSFGAAVIGNDLYVYGGHHGGAHHYSQEGQSGELLRLKLDDPQEWESLAGGPKLTGTAMVAYDGKLYRVGGFTAKNNEGEDQSLWSQAETAVYDPQSNRWEQLPPLPEGRSSHDAAVIGDTLYVVGGWELKGDEETAWHDTAWAMKLSQKPLEWKPVPAPPEHRRALSLAEWQGKLYALGGMQESGGPTTGTFVYDPASQKWSEGPALLGSRMDGFGNASFACGDQLFATTMSGAVQRLSSDGTRWEYVGQLENPRFFHRMLPVNAQELVIVGGAHMAVGKIDSLEKISLTAKP